MITVSPRELSKLRGRSFLPTVVRRYLAERVAAETTGVSIDGDAAPGFVRVVLWARDGGAEFVRDVAEFSAGPTVARFFAVQETETAR